MQCLQCEHENRPGRRFCAECGAPLDLACLACAFVNEPAEKFCGGCGIALTGTTLSSAPRVRHETAHELRFHALLPAVIGLLQSQRRVTFRTLGFLLGLDHTLLEEMRDELVLRRLAMNEADNVLVWTGEAPSAVPSAARPTRPPVDPDALTVASLGPIDDTNVTRDASAAIPEPLHTAPEAERRQLTVMFCDLPDSTPLAQQLDPEDLRTVIRAYQETAAEVIHQYEGYIAQYLGDGLLVYCGWPVAHEDDASRAVHAGLGIVEAITTQLNTRLAQDKGVQLAVRIGIHTGPVVVGEMGGGGRHEHLATGETVNIAARLEGLAQPNTVVMSSVTAHLVERMFALEDLGPQRLKGVAEPMQVFRVLDPMEVDENDLGAVRVPFLVGRDEEVGLLRRRWEQAKEGVGQAVLISGAAGIGKSLLVATLRRHVTQERYTRVAFRCSPYHTNSALYPVITHVQKMLGFARDEPPDSKLDKLEQVLRTTGLPCEESIPLVATLLSVPLGDRYAAPSHSPQQQRQQTLDTLVGWLMAEAERQPVLAVWDDLHWADPSTLELLGLVLEQTPTVPMLHVLTYRPGFEPPWPTRSHMTPMTLNRLERPQVEALIAHLSGDKGLPVEVVQHIVAKTDGVPLYVEELTKMLLTSALLQEEAGQYVLTGPLSTLAIPDTLRDSLMARLDQLSTAKEVAQLGAVLGREFPYEMLQAISAQDEETLQDGLARLVEAELLYQRGRLPRSTYIFKHALIQDAAYASLLRSTLQQMHQQIAEVLETRFPELVETQPELVAYHYTEAGFVEPAIAHWQRAGQRASERSAYQEAISHLTTGLTLLQTLPETLERHQQELPLQTALGTASQIIKGYGAPETEAAYTRARLLCQQLGNTQDVFPVLLGLWRFYVTRAHFPPARQLAEELLGLAERRDESPLYVAAHSVVGTTCMWMGDLRPAHRHLEAGSARDTPAQRRFPMLRAGQDPGVACRALGAWTLWLLGYPDQALAGVRDALELAAALDHPFSEAFALDIASVVCQFRREGQEVYDHAEATISLSAEQGFTYWLAQTTFLRGWALTALGQQEQGLTQMRQGLIDLRATGAEVFAPYFLTLLAEGYGNLHRVNEGLEALREGVELVERIGTHVWQAEVYRLQGALLLHQTLPDVAQAATCFRQALDTARRQQAKSLELRAATSLARLWQSQGKRQDAYDLLAPVYEWFTEGFDTADLKDAKALLSELGESR